MEQISLKDLDEVDILLTELEVSQGHGNLILCFVASPAYRDRIVEAIKSRFPVQIQAVEKGDDLIHDLREIQQGKDKVLVWALPYMLSEDILNALNNFRELFYDTGMPNIVFMTPAAFDDVFWKAPDFWRYRGGYHGFKGRDHGLAFRPVEALSIPIDFSYRSKEELLRRKRINEYLLGKIKDEKAKGKILGEIGTVHQLLSEPHQAIEYHEKALSIAREIGDRRGEGITLWNMSLALDQLGQRAQAIECARAAINILEDIEDPNAEMVKRKLQEWDSP